jgi:hypothetical protein
MSHPTTKFLRTKAVRTMTPPHTVREEMKMRSKILLGILTRATRVALAAVLTSRSTNSTTMSSKHKNQP